MKRVRLAFDALEERALLAAAATVTALGFSAASVRFGQAETLTATVTTAPPGGATPTGGTVTFQDGAVVLGSQPLVNGTAALTVSTLSVGTHGLSASYTGDGSNFAGSSSPTPRVSTVTTVAGDGVRSFGGDGGPAAVASLSFPEGVAVDAAGDVFLADTDNSRVRRVDHATGVISTVAGDGTGGFAGDGGPATAASLSFPIGLALDAAGDLFIADSGNGRVRRVDHFTGLISTVAGSGDHTDLGDGGAATAAFLFSPSGVALDAAGDVFIADTDNNRVRRVDHATGLISTVAGTGFEFSGSGYSGDGGPATAATLTYPMGLALDDAGDLFIADKYNNVIRRVDHATRVISTVAGDGTRGFSGDGGPATAATLSAPEGVAIDAAGDLFLTDTENNRVRRVDHATGLISTVAGGTGSAASFTNPYGVVVDAAGDLFIADPYGNRIREATQAVSTVTVTPTASSQGNDFNGDGTSDLALFDPTTATWLINLPNASPRTVQFGAVGDTAVPGDYQGTGTSQLAVFDPKTATWLIRESTGDVSIPFGDPTKGDVPAPADYDGDGKTDLAVYRPSTGEWFVRPSSGGPDLTYQFGDPSKGDSPVPGDYEGRGRADLAVFRPSSDLWIVRMADGTNAFTQLGNPALHEVPAPGNYDSPSRTEMAVYSPSTAHWIAQTTVGGFSVTTFGPTGTAAVPARSPVVTYPAVSGIARDEQVLFRPSTNEWLIRQADGTLRADPSIMPADPNLVPVPGDYEGTGRLDLAVYRPSDATWFIQKSDGTLSQKQFGDIAFGDQAAPADYDGDGKTDLAVFRPSTAEWIVRPSSGGPDRAFFFGDPSMGDTPVPGDYDGLGKAQPAVFRPSMHEWIIREPDGTDRAFVFGNAGLGDVPAPGGYNGDGKFDVAVYSPTAGAFTILTDPSGTTSFTYFGDPQHRDRPARSPVVVA